jgi:hypothetical protein
VVDRAPPSRRSFLPPPPPRDDAGEDFLFHLYRGSELLQDNRVHDAKAEIEQALALQPTDPKGQDLLGIVYFRLGLYPRAIAIYERLVQAFPDAVEPRINLGLCYLKTGQPSRARAELERTVAHAPQHHRAWGYLGLACQALGDIDRAIHAFTVGGHDAMARRLMDATAGAPPRTARRPSLAPPPVTMPAPFTEIDRSVDLAPTDSLPQSVGGWENPPLSNGQVAASFQAPIAPPPARLPSFSPPISLEDTRPSRAQLPNPSPPSTANVDFSARPPIPATDLGKRFLLVFPRDLRVAQHDPTGLVLVQAQTGFATRLDLVRTMAHPGGYAGQPLQRRMRGRSLDEPLGSAATPLVEIPGKGELVLAPPEGQRLLPITLEDEPIYLREDLLGAFEMGMSYENGRMPAGDGEAVGMVQLRGPGVLVALLPQKLGAVEVTESKSAALRSGSVLGWIGRVIPRALVPSEAPAGARGFVIFSGEGTVLIDGR